MLSNNAGDQIAPAAEAAQAAGIKVVTWDSPIPSAEGESVFVAQVDFDSIGVVMADMALDLISADGGEFAVLSASLDAANQNAWIKSLDEALEVPEVRRGQVGRYRVRRRRVRGGTQALALVDKHPNLDIIMAPTTVGIAAAAKAMQDENLCDKVKVSGLGLPSEMVSYTHIATPGFRAVGFVDLGYLTYSPRICSPPGPSRAQRARYSTPVGWATTPSRRLDPATGLRVVMGPFTVYNKDNVEAAAS